MFNKEAYHKAYYQRNRDKLLMQNKKRKASLSPEITEARRRLYSDRWKIKYKERRQTCLDAYGNACKCCGETTPEFLSFDHVHGGGCKHRRTIGYGTFYKWLIKNGFPQGDFQILCHNCNQAKGFYGVCPHSRLKEAI